MDPELKINAQAKLVEHQGGEIKVLYDGMAFGRDQMVPFHIFGVDSNPTRISTAGAFVTTFMHVRFGIDEGAWPELARRFVNKD